MDSETEEIINAQDEIVKQYEENEEEESEIKEEMIKKQQTKKEPEVKQPTNPDPWDEPIDIDNEEAVDINWKRWLTLLLIIIIAAGIYTKGFGYIGGGTTAIDVTNQPTTGFSYIVLSDTRCAECDTTGIETQLQTVFPGAEVKKYDYNTKEGKALFEKLELLALPAILFTETVKEQTGYADVSGYLEPKGTLLSLKIGATHDPNAEICDNEIDDNENGKIDCADEDCSNDFKCLPKTDKPKVELFVMSHCPYGTQIEKGMLPVIKALGNEADFEIKFCDYAMHGKKEIDEQLNQHCIQKEQDRKFISYLECFLKEGDGESCLTETKIDTAKLDTCVKETDEKLSISKDFEDKTTYKGQFPTFAVDQLSVDKYGVQGSPTLVVNGVVTKSNRDPASLMKTVCLGFSTKPEACTTTISSESPTPGFGYETTNTASAASCAT